MTALTLAALRPMRTSNKETDVLSSTEKMKPYGELNLFAVRVPDVSREIYVKMASTRSEREGAFQLVTDNYRNRGYESATCGQLRFTAHHALPETVVFIAKHLDRVIMTMSLVFDNCLLGLPMEELYASEISKLRDDNKKLVEVTSLADKELSLREFVPVFVAMMRMMAQYGIYNGAELFTVAINPRHRRFYAKVMGFEPFGPLREYPCVRNHPAEAYKADVATVKLNAPSMHQKLFRHWFPRSDLSVSTIPTELVRHFGRQSSQTTVEEVDRILDWTARHGSPRRW